MPLAQEDRYFQTTSQVESRIWPRPEGIALLDSGWAGQLQRWAWAQVALWGRGRPRAQQQAPQELESLGTATSQLRRYKQFNE